MCLLVRLPLIKHHLVASLITEGLTTQRISNVYRCVCTDSFCRAQIGEVKVGDLDFSNARDSTGYKANFAVTVTLMRYKYFF